MKNFNRFLIPVYLLNLLIMVLLTGGQGVTGQSLLVGIPSADVAKTGHIEFTHESQWGRKDGQLDWNSFNFLTYGVSARTEVAVSLINVSSPGSGNVAVGVGYKTVVPLGKAREATGRWHERKLSLGQMVYAATSTPAITDPLAGRDRIGGWVYGHLSGRHRTARTRLTAGLSYGSSHVFGLRSVTMTPDGTPAVTLLRPNTPLSVMAGLEQPITKHVSFVMDWFSGNHDIAALIPAVQLNLGRQVVILGYKRANDQRTGSNALVTELMLHF
jgi:hypothetical protein